jgi:Trypsin-like peptidase domain
MDTADRPVSSFVFRNDPARDAKHGDRLRFEQVKPHFELARRFTDVANWQVFEGMLLGVMSLDSKKQSTILGSAIMAAPGIALTATHIFTKDSDDLLVESQRGNLSIVCFGIASTGAQAWNIKQVTCIDGTDMAILGLEYASDMPPTRTFYQATLTTRAPEIGERLIMAGLRSACETFEQGRDRTTELAASLYLSSGVVTARCMERRDSVKLPWPTLVVDCPTLGGMSGGPVFDSRGFLVGMVTAAMVCEDEPSPTYTALLWKLFGQKFIGGWPSTLVESEPKSFLDLHDRHLCEIERASAVQMSIEQGRPTLTYSLWS